MKFRIGDKVRLVAGSVRIKDGVVNTVENSNHLKGQIRVRIGNVLSAWMEESEWEFAEKPVSPVGTCKLHGPFYVPHAQHYTPEHE